VSARFTVLERQVLPTWIEEGVIDPAHDEEGYLFGRFDESRVPHGPRPRERAGHSLFDRSTPRVTMFGH